MAKPKPLYETKMLRVTIPTKAEHKIRVFIQTQIRTHQLQVLQELANKGEIKPS